MVHVSATPVLALRGVSKRFGAVQALTDVELEVHAGEVVALVGDNGAGKSTLVKTIAGVHPIDEGVIEWEGRPVQHQQAARRPGPGHRDRLPGPRAVRQPRRRRQPLPRPRDSARAASSTRSRWSAAPGSCWTRCPSASPASASRSPRSPAVSARPSPSPARMLGDPKVVILDEPTAALGVEQTAQVLDLVERLRERGHARHPHQPQHGRRARPSRTRSRCCGSAATTASSTSRPPPTKRSSPPSPAPRTTP